MASYIKASTFYIEGLLASLDAIKRKSFFNSTAIVDASVLNSAVENMIDWAAIIGSQDKTTARRILKSFNTTMSEDDILKVMSSKWDKTCPANDNPIKAINQPIFLEKESAIEVALLNSFDVQMHLANFCMEGLMWGMTYPDAVTKYLKENQSRMENELPIFQKVDPKITHAPSFSEVVNESKQIAEKYLSTISGIHIKNSPSLKEDEGIYQSARDIVLAEKTASVSLLQRKLSIQYAQASRIIDMLETRGVIAWQEHDTPKKYIVNE